MLGALEGAEATVFASGMTAWTCVCLTVLGQGKSIVIPTSGYYEVELLASEVLGRFGVEVRRYDLRDSEGFRRACEGATLAVVETPSNPSLAVTDIARPPPPRMREARCSAATTRSRRRSCSARSISAPTSPGRARRNTSQGTPTCSPASSRRATASCGSASVYVRRTIGGVLAPDPAWLLLRGLRTLHVRLPRQVATASELARRLAAHPAVATVHYPGLPDHPEYELARRQMPAGAGGVLAFELADGETAGQLRGSRAARSATRPAWAVSRR